jgi:hypothetical protein
MDAGYVANVRIFRYFWESHPFFLCQPVINVKVGRNGGVVRLGDTDARNKRAKRQGGFTA